MVEYVLIIIIGILFSALFSGMETGGYTLNRIKLKRRVIEKNEPACRLHQALKRPYRYIFTVLVGNNIAIYFSLHKHQ